MTKRQLELFLTLIQTGSFTETSNIHFMTQPAVSQQIQSLENDIGCRLFVRSKKGITLTEAGKILAMEGPALLSYSQSVYKKIMQRSTEKRTVRTLCYIPVLRILPALIGRFAIIRPDITISIFPVNPLDRNSQLIFERNDMTVGFGNPEEEYDRLQFVPLYEGEFVCLLNRNHPLSDRTILRMCDLRNEVVYSLEESHQNQMFHSVNDALASSSAAMLFPTLHSFYEGTVIAATGDGIAVVPNTGPIPEDYCVSVKFEYPQKYYLGLFISQNPPSDIQEFCLMAKTICENDNLPPIIL